jgi:hypothetical protein
MTPSPEGDQMLDTVHRICSPETFQALLTIFDTAWAEISASPNFIAETTEEQRTRLAQFVMDQMERSDLTQTEKVRNEVIRKFRSGKD